MHRRQFLMTSGAALGTAALGARPSYAAPSQPIGLQLFTVMTLLEQDFEGTLARVAKIGYREVETIGAFGRDPHEVRRLFDKYRLRSPSQHLVPGTLYDVFLRFTRRELTADEVSGIWQREMSIDRIQPIIEEAIERARVLGQKYIVLQIIWPEQMRTRALLDAFCKALDTAGELCARAGMTFNFHNHAVEFEPRDGYVPYDVILANTDPRTVQLEMDFFWFAQGKADPLAYLQRHPGRFVQCHVKDATANGDFATVGQGVLDIPAFVTAARQAGIEHFYVEYDRADDPMQVVQDAYAYLRKRM